MLNHNFTEAKNKITPPIHRILVVDDDHWVRETTVATVEFLGYECSMVGSAYDALNVLEVGGFDLVISDISMYGMDGFELLRQIRIRWPGVPVILCSGYYDKTRLAKTILLLPVLDKPYSMQELENAINRAEKYVGVVVPPEKDMITKQHIDNYAKENTH